MSDVTSHYIVRVKHVAETQSVSLRTSHLRVVAQRRGDQEKPNLFRSSPRKYRTHPRETSYENI